LFGLVILPGMTLIPIAGPFVALYCGLLAVFGYVSGATEVTRHGTVRHVLKDYHTAFAGSVVRPLGALVLFSTLAQPGLAWGQGLAKRLALAPVVEVWDGEADLTCERKERYRAEGLKTARGINASGECQVTLHRCSIGDVVQLDGRAKLQLDGGALLAPVEIKDSATLEASGTAFGNNAEGTHVAADASALPRGLSASDDARITLNQCRVAGRVELSDEAALRLTGGALLAPPEIKDDATFHASGTAFATGATSALVAKDLTVVTIAGARLEAEGDVAVVATGKTKLTLKDTTVIGKCALLATGQATVKLESVTLRGQAAGLRLEDVPYVSALNTHVRADDAGVATRRFGGRLTLQDSDVCAKAALTRDGHVWRGKGRPLGELIVPTNTRWRDKGCPAE
jgi:hypothetical protein